EETGVSTPCARRHSELCRTQSDSLSADLLGVKSKQESPSLDTPRGRYPSHQTSSSTGILLNGPTL
ncbi:unnamed protein product, partial [Lampetra fluviatilis]